jgi:predicted Zn-dependent protease
MLKYITTSSIFILILALLIPGCKKENAGLISREQEIELGRKADSVITVSPGQFPVLDTGLYHDAYSWLDTLVSEIVRSGHLQRENAFDYQVKMINRDIIHAFAYPGGYLYFYTGLINLLDNEAQFAGVMSHMIVHADRRHITGNLENKYGIDQLLSVVWGDNPGILDNITGYLTRESGAATFSNQQEYEADEFAVKILSDTDYDPRGILYFYEKLNQSLQTGTYPGFLEIHPDPGNRLEFIEEIWEELGSPEGDLFTNKYQNFKLLLPGN